MLCVQQTTENGSFSPVFSQTKWLNLRCLEEIILHTCWSTVVALGQQSVSSGAPGVLQALQTLHLAFHINISKHCNTVVSCRRKGTCNVLFHVRQQRHWISLCCLLNLPELLLWDASFTICNICGSCTSTEILHVSCKVGKAIILPNTEWSKNNSKYLTVSFE